MIPNAMKIMVAGGREVMFGDEQYKIFEKGANAFVIGDYLTTQGKTPADDIAELEKHGYKIKRKRLIYNCSNTILVLLQIIST